MMEPDLEMRRDADATATCLLILIPTTDDVMNLTTPTRCPLRYQKEPKLNHDG